MNLETLEIKKEPPRKTDIADNPYSLLYKTAMQICKYSTAIKNCDDWLRENSNCESIEQSTIEHYIRKTHHLTEVKKNMKDYSVK